MTIRRFLIAAPAFVTLVLMLSYFWVPTYEEQTRGNPDRLEQFITASIGDATLLNPILSANSASSQIEGLVFEGLIDRDENLNYRGRVAQRWRIYEHAYFSVNHGFETTRWGALNGTELRQRLETALKADATMAPHVISVDLLPEVNQSHTRVFAEGSQKKSFELIAKVPERIRVTLSHVDQLFFKKLEALLGQGYFERFDAASRVTSTPPMPLQRLAGLAKEILPTTEHNPVIEFSLRPGIRFHDGHPVTAEDVKFTYEAIVNPDNLSPRIPDYEPVKQVDIIDALTVRITYKRLYSPAIGTWAMGILPRHRLDAAALAKEAVERGQDPKQFGLRQSKFNRHPIGCGPFVFQSWKSDQYIRLKRFDDYWEGPANYREYVMRIIPDMLTQEMEFYAGTVDDYTVQPHQVARLSKDDRFQNFSGAAFGYSYIGYNLRRPPFDDPRVRRALGMAIDTQKIIDFILYGQGERITGPFCQTDRLLRSFHRPAAL